MSDANGVKIHLSAYDVWPFFEENKERPGKEMVCIAENTETEYSVYLEEKSGIPFFKVFREEAFEYGEAATCALECREIAKKLYRKYLFPITVVEDQKPDKADKQQDDMDGDFSDGSIPDEEEQIEILDDIVYERDDELHLAVADFMSTLLNVRPDEVEQVTYEGFCEDFMKKIGLMLAEEESISIYHPTWVPDETGVQFFTEYPYLDIDDENTIAGRPSDFGNFDFTEMGE